MKLLRNLWCALFHGRYTSQRSASGDWCQIHCSKCRMTRFPGRYL